MSNAILTTRLALTRWQQDLHHLSTIVHLCVNENDNLDDAALQSLRSIIASMRKEFKLADQLLDQTALQSRKILKRPSY